MVGSGVPAAYIFLKPSRRFRWAAKAETQQPAHREHFNGCVRGLRSACPPASPLLGTDPSTGTHRPGSRRPACVPGASNSIPPRPNPVSQRPLPAHRGAGPLWGAGPRFGEPVLSCTESREQNTRESGDGRRLVTHVSGNRRARASRGQSVGRAGAEAGRRGRMKGCRPSRHGHSHVAPERVSRERQKLQRPGSTGGQGDGLGLPLPERESECSHFELGGGSPHVARTCLCFRSEQGL